MILWQKTDKDIALHKEFIHNKAKLFLTHLELLFHFVFLFLPLFVLLFLLLQTLLLPLLLFFTVSSVGALAFLTENKSDYSLAKKQSTFSIMFTFTTWNISGTTCEQNNWIKRKQKQISTWKHRDQVLDRSVFNHNISEWRVTWLTYLWTWL